MNDIVLQYETCLVMKDNFFWANTAHIIKVQ